MVIYDIQCAFGHRFEGWFPNAAAFDKQLESGLVSCSICGSIDVNKIPSGVHIAVSKSQPKKVDRVDAGQSAKSDTDKTINVDPVVFIKAVNQFIKANFKDVGAQFTDQAIDMHKGKIPEEPIHGTTTPADREILEEAGVSYTQVPKLPESVDN